MAVVKESPTPYVCHIFVCVNDRQGQRGSCADGHSMEVKDYLKGQVDQRGWKPRVRVSHCGCLGLCQQGPNVMLYPQRVLFSEVTRADADQILARIAELIA